MINNKDVIDYKNKSGIYRLQCSHCPRFYIGKTARTLNIRVAEHFAAFRLKKDTSTFMITSTFNNKDGMDYKNKSGIYKLQCSHCPRFYIGKTARTLNIRVAEHLATFRLKKDTSTFANHLILENHTFKFDSGIDLLHTNRG